MEASEYIEKAAEFYQDEITDRAFYDSLAERISDDQFRKSLRDLAKIEDQHAAFWGSELKKNNVDASNIRAKHWKLRFLFFIMRVIGPELTVRMLEHGETKSIAQYKEMLDHLPADSPIRSRLSEILDDEIEHEDIFENQIEKTEEQVERNRDIIYGMSDGLVEVLGAIAGLTAILLNGYFIALGGLVVAISGAMSMALSAYLSAKHQTEFKIHQIQKQTLFKPAKSQKKAIDRLQERSSESAARTAAYYLMGAAIPILPFLLLDRYFALIVSVILVAVTQALSNSIIALSMNARIMRSALRAAGLTLITAAATFIVGEAFHYFFNISLV